MSTRQTGFIRPRAFCPRSAAQPDVRVARTHDEVAAAWHLLYRVYTAVGFISPNPFSIHTVPQAVTNESAVFIGIENGQLRGTITAMGDGAMGLPLDTVFEAELEVRRRSGSRMMEVGLFADADDSDGTVISMMFELMRYSCYFGLHSGVTEFICGIPPKRVRLYEKLLGFTAASEVRSYSTVSDEPVVLMIAETGRLIADNSRYRGPKYFSDHPLAEDAFDGRFDFDRLLGEDSGITAFLRESAGAGVGMAA